MLYPTKKLQEILDKTKFTIGKIKTSDYLSNGKNPIIDQGKNLIAGYSNYDNFVYSGKLPVIVYGDHTNIIKYVDFPFIGGADGIKVLSFNNNCDVKYCYYLLETFKPETQGYRRHFSFFKEIDLPLPPLPTQKLIVQKLDSSFEKIYKSIELTKKNLENIEELNKSVLEEVFREGEYEMKTIDEICIKKDLGLVRGQNEQFYDKGLNYLKMNNISNFNGDIILDKLVKVEVGNDEKMKYLLEKGDFLFNTRNSIELVGKTALFNLDGDYLFNNNILRFRFINNIFPEYINKIFLSNFIRIQLEKMKSGTTNVSAIYYKNLKDLQIPLPPLQKQKEIVAQLDKVFEKNKALKESYEKKLKDLEEMKQSLLKEAFEGRLVKE